MSRPLEATPADATWLARAQAGPAFEAELIPLTQKGRLRVTYNWLYSALNCDPNDESHFAWIIHKIDEQHVALSPKDPFDGMRLYASVRDDDAYYVQVQAPYSADWIRAVGRDETLSLKAFDLLVVQFSGFNGRPLAVDPDLSRHDWHAGYRIRSVGSTDLKASLWFLGVNQLLQPDLALPVAAELTRERIGRALGAAGLGATGEAVSAVVKALRGVDQP